jgi:hypothetical protein
MATFSPSKTINMTEYIVVIFDYRWCEVMTKFPHHGYATRRNMEEIDG